MKTKQWSDYGCPILSPFEKWMAKSNLKYIKAEGLDAVIERLRAQGYNRVAEEVINLTRVALITPKA